MPKDRVPVNLDREPHDEPFITGADYIRSRQDNSQLPGSRGGRDVASYDTGETTDREVSRPAQQRNTRRPQSSRSASRNRSSQSANNRRSQSQTDDNQQDLEDAAVTRLVRKLREKGVSESYIHGNMGEIRQRARRELLDRDE